jgi:tocopherol O-methyltransferase
MVCERMAFAMQHAVRSSNSHTLLLAVLSVLLRRIDCEAEECAWAAMHGQRRAWDVQFIAELTRVCKPGGRILIVTWCHRVLEAGETALKPDEEALLKDICSAYYLPAWCSIADYARIAESNGLTVRTLTSLY